MLLLMATWSKKILVLRWAPSDNEEVTAFGVKYSHYFYPSSSQPFPKDWASFDYFIGSLKYPQNMLQLLPWSLLTAHMFNRIFAFA